MQNTLAIAFSRIENVVGGLALAGASAFVLMLVFGVY